MMILTTTPTLEGRNITAYLGVVAGEAALNTNFIRDFFTSVVQAMGERVEAPEKRLAEAREVALHAMEEKATALGANAVVGVKIEYTRASDLLLLIAATGTAVQVE